MHSLTLPAPAKINLFLHITGRRPDGYHTLQTAFQLLDFGDTLHLTAVEDGDLTVFPSLPGVAAGHNLVLRAAALLQDHTGCERGAAIRVTKRLPMGGGLGGGSSDAATTLVGLNTLWELGLSLDELAELGVRLGADVPVFVHGRSAFAEGIGDQLRPVELRETNYLILIPPCQVSTAEIFSAEALTRNTTAITIAAFLEQGGRNDCEPVVRALYPEVAFAVDWLSLYSPARMTGTGACVFAEFDQRADAEAVLARLPAGYQGFVARAVNRSPLHQQLNL
ncbi:MAG: 4-(cytidine 5'-diphospho)-2-C-methyl-D-erythritol kinase [Spongiibacteraceae bacterium]|jgi:4-diphosphocytidyl-2-C-methyl-D-erythritol kinase|nr:4-(cytidine 5'-diphospho)-2-C-methyl-D-erythritol kinase [Spongiibacteraceae bacterium]